MPHDTIAGLGTILGIWGHPDDEAYLSAGVMAIATAQGQRVVCVTATYGEAGFADDDPRPIDERAALRAAEMEACLAVLGVNEHHWLGYPDGRCDEVEDAEAVLALTPIIDDVRPDTVLTFGPDGMTGHVDHIAVSRWATLAFRDHETSTGRAPALLYATKTPDWVDRFEDGAGYDVAMMDERARVPTTAPEDLALWLALEPTVLETKLEALHTQPSQVEPYIEVIGVGQFREIARDEFFRAARAGEWP
jgi:LmbE family N-acetylglucosaminyl deacetylase